MTHEVLDRAPLAECARRLAGKIDNPAVAARFARLAYEQLRADPRNVRPAEAADLVGAPDWARRKVRTGAPVYVFAACPSSLARLRRVARQLQHTCAEAYYLDTLPRARLNPREAAMCDLMRDFIAKIAKPDFATVDAKSRLFARDRKSRLDETRANEIVCAPEKIRVAGWLAWERIASVAQMWAVGEEFRNCMARGSANSAAYARQLRTGEGHFFVLRDAAGKGLMVALAYPAQMRIEDVRAPANAIVDPEHPAVLALCFARGWRGGGKMFMRTLERIRAARMNWLPHLPQPPRATH